jgi:hypothetical protein
VSNVQQRMRAMAKRMEDMDTEEEESTVDDDLTPKPWVPAAYQKIAVKWLLEHAAAGLFADPGLRKTSICLAALKILRREGVLRRVLVVAPLRPCYGVWDSRNPASELRKWTDFHDIQSVVLHGGDKERALDHGIRNGVTLFVINPDGLPWLMSGGRFQRLKPDTLLVDESTMFRNTRTQRFKQLEPTLNYFSRRWILTGTPTPKGLLDLFGQVKILDLGRALGRYITHYRMKYFDQTGFGGFTWKPKPGAEPAIYKALATMVHRVDGEDAGIDLPKLVDNPIYVYLPPAARLAYDELESELITKIGNNTIRAANAAVATTKCAQVANGGLYLPGPVGPDGIPIKAKRKWTNLHEVKIDAIEALRDELDGKPMLVTYDFDHDLDRLRKRFGDVPAVGGGTSPAESTHYERMFNAGKLEMLAIHPASTHGLNPQGGGCNLVWGSLTYNMEHYEQTWRRLVRSGQKSRRVMNHLLIAKDTVDEFKVIALRRKAKGQTALLDALRTYAQRKRAAARRAGR